MSSGVAIGIECSTPRRWFELSIQPPAPVSDAFRNVSGDTQSASPAAAMISSCVRRASRSRSG